MPQGVESNLLDGGQFRVEEVGLDSPRLEAVMKLHSASKHRLGPFPRGAFEDHAQRKLILAAVTADNEVAGYVLYRVAKSRAAVVHLTSSCAFRGKGVARLLVDALKARTCHLLGISLRCRRDYGIAKIWQSFGFTVRHSKEGRGADGALLDYWWFDHNHEDLFSQAALRDDASQRLLTVVDANIFFDLICDGRSHADDTRVLQADWLQDSIALYITKEIYNEIQRSANENEKKRCRMAAQKFLELKTDDAQVRAVEVRLAPFFKGTTAERDISDMRQVAHAIAAEAPFFITRDKAMLDRGVLIFEKFGLRLLHPTDLVNRIDVFRREAEYRPARLEGSNWHQRLVTSEDVGSIVSLFKHKSRERSGTFDQKVRHYLVNPSTWRSSIIAEAQKSATVYLVSSRGDPARLEISLFRHTDHPLAGTLLRHLGYELGSQASGAKVKLSVVTDPELSEEAIAALTEVGFLLDGDMWWKISINGLITQDNLVSEIKSAHIPTSLKERLLGAVVLATGPECQAVRGRLENLFSPAKVISPNTPCYVVSMRQSWAAHFFDIPLGGQTLMDLNERLHLGIEGVYYCSALNTFVTAPGRVLWYVSGRGSMSIKACSHLEERFVGPPKELYARLRHLGVYAWKHVLETAGSELDKPLMAFRFTRTERFVHAITLAELQQMGIPQPQNPRRITDEQFGTIYRLGMNL